MVFGTISMTKSIPIDTLGFVIALAVTNAAISDRDGAALVFSKIGGICQRLTIIWADGGYRGNLLH